METTEKRIENWTEETVKQYVEMTKNGFNYAFYTQSDLRDIKESPEYFICQINPGSTGNYSEQISNKNWELNGKDMDAEHFIRGNYCVVGEKDNKPITSWENRNKWKDFQKLYSFFSLIEEGNPLKDVSKFVLTNATCFATPKTNNIIYKALEKTLPLTLKLADIVKPKRIIFLGSKLPYYIEKIIDKDMFVIKDSSLPRIKYGSIYGYETLFIDHPSAPTYKGDIKEVIRLWRNNMSIEKAIEQTEKKYNAIVTAKKNQ